MPSISKSQQRLMGMALAYKRGKKKLKNLPKSLATKIKKLANSMSDESLSDFAKTKHSDIKENNNNLNYIKNFNDFDY